MNTLGLAAQPTEYDAPRHPVASPCRVSLRPRGLDVDIERFWARVDQSGGPDACWPWAGPLSNQGYGRVTFGGRTQPVHRVAYELVRGPMPTGLVSDHLCRNRACCNPAHLEPVTNRVNVLRGISPLAANAAKTHCVHGHEFTLENVKWRTKPGERPYRVCRQCHRDTKRRLRRAAYKRTSQPHSAEGGPDE